MNLFIKTEFLILVHLTLFQTSYANDIRRKLECRKDSTENLKKYSQIISDTVIKIVNTKSLPDSLTGEIEIVFDISDSGNIENVILEKGYITFAVVMLFINILSIVIKNNLIIK